MSHFKHDPDDDELVEEHKHKDDEGTEEKSAAVEPGAPDEPPPHD